MAKDIIQIGFEFEFGTELSDKQLRSSLKIAFPDFVGGAKSKRFTVTGDGSVHVNGMSNDVEIISPVMPLSVGLSTLRKFLEWMQIIAASTNDTCGLHINLSFIDPQRNAKIDKLKLVCLFDEYKWVKAFGRSNNTYCDPLRKQFVEKYKSRLSDYWVYNQHKTIEMAAKLVIARDAEKHSAINIKKLKTRNKYVEFRFAGNAGYEKKFDLIHDSIKECVDAMKKSIVKSRYNDVVKRELEKLVAA